ncbi:MAG: ABC transporter ATP-binding protein [Clostridia bacterium]|nr:ABC transporter ATP-binding protein [Clostridia bacterium]
MNVVLKNLTKIFPGRNRGDREVIAVKDFDLEIPDGKLVALLGPSGCGKSTILNLICGLETPSKGQIFFGERDITNVPPEQRGVGMVFQNYALYPHMTVRQNILFPLQNFKGRNRLPKEEMEKRALEAARLVKLDNLMSRKPGQMSGGQQQRAAIARALVKLPDLLLLDEPLSNLDARLRLETREEIRRIQKETNITTVFVTHDQEEALSISDMIVVMKAGVLMQLGKPQDVYDDPVNLFVAEFLGTPAINVFAGEVRDGKIMVGDDVIGDAPGIPSQPVDVGIRPEGFIPGGSSMHMRFKALEVMGRDMSIVSESGFSKAPTVRAIVSSSADAAPRDGVITFDIKPEKLYIFGKETGERIYTGRAARQASAVTDKLADSDGLAVPDDLAAPDGIAASADSADKVGGGAGEGGAQ